jgi:hypothetical protein
MAAGTGQPFNQPSTPGSGGGNDPGLGSGSPGGGNSGPDIQSILPGSGGNVPVVVNPPPTTTTLADQLAAELAALQLLQNNDNLARELRAVPKAVAPTNNSKLIWMLVIGAAVGAYFYFRKKRKEE